MGLGVGAQDSMRNLEIKQRITPDLPSYITLSAPVNLYIVFVNLPVTVFLIFWDIIFLTNPPVPATVSQPGGRSALPLKISPQLPDQENTTAPTIYRHRHPSFTMQGRTKRPNYSSAIPGPGAYSPERFHLHLPRPPSFTLGIRHSEFVTPLVVNVTD